MDLICFVTLPGHMVKGSSDFMKGSFSLNVATLLGLVAITIVIVDILCFYIIKWPHVTTCL